MILSSIWVEGFRKYLHRIKSSRWESKKTIMCVLFEVVSVSTLLFGCMLADRKKGFLPNFCFCLISASYLHFCDWGNFTKNAIKMTYFGRLVWREIYTKRR